MNSDVLFVILLAFVFSFCIFNVIYFSKLLSENIENPDSTSISNPKTTYFFIIILNILAIVFFFYVYYINNPNKKSTSNTQKRIEQNQLSSKFFKGSF